jgi:hypothetical protein
MQTTIAILTLAAAASAQTTWHVDVNGVPPGTGTQTDPYTSLQAAHDQPSTVDGDTVLVAPGTYVGNYLFTKRITVRSAAGAEATILRPATTGPVLRPAAPLDELDVLIIEGFTITGHLGPFHQGAVESSEGTLVRCIVRDNPGMGVSTSYDTNLVDCTVTGNVIGVEYNTLSEAIWMKNCVVWGNGTNCSSNIFPIGSQIRYCAGGPFPFASGPGNLVGDPGLWDVANGDIHLRPGSPCIDAGDPALFDPDGSRSDIGYHAYDPGYAPIATYCVAKPNSHGCTPAIAASGLPSLTSPNPFLVTASLVLPGRRGLLLYSMGPDAAPFQGATLCVALPYRRVGGQTSQGAGPCGGTFAYDFNIRIQSGADPSLVPGALVYTQWWHRDPNDPAGFQSGMTDGLRFGVAP